MLLWKSLWNLYICSSVSDQSEILLQFKLNNWINWLNIVLLCFSWLLDHVIISSWEQNNCYIKLSKFTKSELFSLKLKTLFIHARTANFECHQIWIPNNLGFIVSDLMGIHKVTSSPSKISIVYPRPCVYFFLQSIWNYLLNF